MSALPPERKGTGEEPERDWDAEFEEIAQHLGNLGDAPVRPGFNAQWRVPEPEEPASSASASPRLALPPSSASTPQSPPEQDEEFIPAPPAPLTRDDPATTIMIGALILGPVWLAYLAMFDREARTLWWVLASLLVTLGFVLAVMRQPRSRDEDDTDDGARV